MIEFSKERALEDILCEVEEELEDRGFVEDKLWASDSDFRIAVCKNSIYIIDALEADTYITSYGCEVLNPNIYQDFEDAIADIKSAIAHIS